MVRRRVAIIYRLCGDLCGSALSRICHIWTESLMVPALLKYSEIFWPFHLLLFFFFFFKMNWLVNQPKPATWKSCDYVGNTLCAVTLRCKMSDWNRDWSAASPSAEPVTHVRGSKYCHDIVKKKKRQEYLSPGDLSPKKSLKSSLIISLTKATWTSSLYLVEGDFFPLLLPD